jgi:hypothetical protein
MNNNFFPGWPHLRPNEESRSSPPGSCGRHRHSGSTRPVCGCSRDRASTPPRRSHRYEQPYRRVALRSERRNRIRVHGERQRADRFRFQLPGCRTCTSIAADPGFFFGNPRNETRHAGQRNPDPGGAIGDLISDLVGGFFNQEQIE